MRAQKERKIKRERERAPLSFWPQTRQHLRLPIRIFYAKYFGKSREPSNRAGTPCCAGVGQLHSNSPPPFNNKSPLSLSFLLFHKTERKPNFSAPRDTFNCYSLKMCAGRRKGLFSLWLNYTTFIRGTLN